MASYFLLIFALVLPLFHFLKSKYISSKSHYNLPPGPWKLPIIGSLHHLIGAGHPHHELHKMSQRYGSLISLQLGEHPTVVVSSSEAAREIYKTHDLTFSARHLDTTVNILTYGGKDIVFAPYGEHWRKVRKICVSELLSSMRVQSFRSIREEEIGSFIQNIASSSSSGQIINLSTELMAVTNNVLLRAIMGNKFKDQQSVMDDILKAFGVSAGFSLVNLFPSSRIAQKFSSPLRTAEECHKSFDQLLDNLIGEHTEKGVEGEVDGLLGVLLRLHDEDSVNSLLTIDTVKAIVLDLITGGTEPTATTLDWLMAELMRNPVVMKKAQTEVRQQLRGRENITELDLSKLNFMRLVIKEILRLHPVAVLNQRKCQETCKILGYDIPKGTNVLINTWGIGRNSKYWGDADEFRPERFADINADVHFNGMDFDLIPFGSGRRICPGMSFAVATIDLVLANLLYHFNWELPRGMTPDQVDMTEIVGLTSSRKYPLLVHAQPYQGCA